MVEYPVVAVLADVQTVTVLNYHGIDISRPVSVCELAVRQLVYLCKRFHALCPIGLHMLIVLIETTRGYYFTVLGIGIFSAEAVCADGIIKHCNLAGF